MLRQLFLNNFVLIVQYSVGAAIPLALTPHIVRSVGLGAYGDIAVALSWGGLASVVVQYAFPLTGPKRVAQLADSSASGAILREITLAKLLLLAVAFPVATGFAIGFPGGGAEVTLIVVGALSLSAALNATWYLQAIGAFGSVGAIAVLGSLATLWIGFRGVALEGPDSARAAAFISVAPQVVLGLGTVCVAWLRSPPRSRSHFALEPIQSLREGWPLFASQFASGLYSLAGPIVVSAVSKPEEVGAYGAIERFINALVTAGLLTHVAAYPRLAALFSRDRASYVRLLGTVLAIYVAMMAIVASLIWLFREEVNAFLFGADVALKSALLAWSLVWLVIAVVGTVLTGYWTVSGQSSKVLSLTARVLALSLLMGVPAAAVFGGSGWMASLVLSQSLVLYEAYRTWRGANAS